jgi:hypothetical protein
MRTMRLLGLCAVVIGFWLMLAPVTVFPNGHWQNLVNDLAVGSLVVAAGLWRAYGARGTRMATISLAVLGAIEFISPWLYGQDLAGARWNAWLTGFALMALAGVITSYHPNDRPLHFTFLPDLIPTDPVIPFRRPIKRKPKGERTRRRRTSGAE